MPVLIVFAFLLLAPHEDLRWDYRIEVPANWVQDATTAEDADESAIFRSPDKAAAIAIIPLASAPGGPPLRYADIKKQRQGGLPVRSHVRRTVNDTEFILEFRSRDDTHQSDARACIESFEQIPRGVERSNGVATNISGIATSPTTPDWSTQSDADPSDEDAATLVEIFYGTTREQVSARAAQMLAWLAAYGSFLAIVFWASRRSFWATTFSWSGFAALGVALFLLSTSDGFPILFGAATVAWAMSPPTLRCLLRRRWRWMARASSVVLGLATAAAFVVAYTDEAQLYDQQARIHLAYGSGRASARPQRSSEFGCEVGVCTVSIPEDRLEGEIPLPMVGIPDPADHFLMADVEVLGDKEFRARIAARAAQSKRRDAVLFVHGYNTSFNSAAFRLAQIVHDLQFEGAPILFSWPSKGDFLRYSHDEAEVVVASETLATFLMALHETDGIERFYVLAHSMGCRVLGLALRSLSSRGWDEKFDVIVLAAPDIDEEAFRTVIAPELKKRTDCPTVYVSKNDSALMASYGFHGYRRAGDAAPSPIVIEGIDTIDVSAISADHTYIGTNYRVMSDLDTLLRNLERAPQRMGPNSRLRFDPALGCFWMDSSR